MRTTLPLASACLLATLCLSTGAPASASTRMHRTAAARHAAPVTAHAARVSSRALLRALNAQRRRYGLRRLHYSARLSHAAAPFARAMAQANFFDHTGPDGRTFAQRIMATGYLHGSHRWNVAENLGWGTGSLGGPNAIVQGWMASAEHRANILNPVLRDVGIGIAYGSPVPGMSDRGARTYVTDFGTR